MVRRLLIGCYDGTNIGLRVEHLAERKRMSTNLDGSLS